MCFHRCVRAEVDDLHQVSGRQFQRLRDGANVRPMTLLGCRQHPNGGNKAGQAHCNVLLSRLGGRDEVRNGAAGQWLRARP